MEQQSNVGKIVVAVGLVPTVFGFVGEDGRDKPDRYDRGESCGTQRRSLRR